MFDDGVEYAWCPRCNATVDWIDGRFDVSVCDACDLVVNKLQSSHECPNCHEPLVHVSPPLDRWRGTRAPAASPSLLGMARRAGIALLVLQTVFALFDPHGFPYLGPLLVFSQLGAVVTLAWLALSSRELRALASDHGTRIVHGLEHATANVLEERGFPLLGGQTRRGRFALEIVHDGKHYEFLEDSVALAAKDAISRLRFGEDRLAFDPRCGTSLLVAIALLALSIAGSGAAALFLGMATGTAFALTVIAGWLARLVARRAGLAVQRWLTVSTAFASAVVTRIDTAVSADGRTITAAVTVDVIPAAVDVSTVPV